MDSGIFGGLGDTGGSVGVLGVGVLVGIDGTEVAGVVGTLVVGAGTVVCATSAGLVEG